MWEMEKVDAEELVAAWVLTSINPMDSAVLRVAQEPGPQRVYQPLENHLLYREFADLPTELNDATLLVINRFANIYGLLLGSAHVYFPLDASDDLMVPRFDWPGRDDKIAVGTGDDLFTWIEQISNLKAAAALWDLIVAEDTVGLANVLRIGDDGTIRHSQTEWLYRAAWLRENEWDGSLLDAAELLLNKVVSNQLNTDGDAVKARLVRNIGERRSKIIHVPVSLIAVMWLQLARAIELRTKYDRCVVCRSWFEYDPTKQRNGKSKRYCLPKCSMRAYRERKQERESTSPIDGTGDNV